MLAERVLFEKGFEGLPGLGKGSQKFARLRAGFGLCWFDGGGITTPFLPPVLAFSLRWLKDSLHREGLVGCTVHGGLVGVLGGRFRCFNCV